MMTTSDGPAIMSMPTDAEDAAFGRRDISVAGADDLVDRGDRRRAIGQRGDRLRAADAVDLVDAGDARRRQHQRIELAVGRRHDHRDARGSPRPWPARRS